MNILSSGGGVADISSHAVSGAAAPGGVNGHGLSSGGGGNDIAISQAAFGCACWSMRRSFAWCLC